MRYFPLVAVSQAESLGEKSREALGQSSFGGLRQNSPDGRLPGTFPVLPQTRVGSSRDVFGQGVQREDGSGLFSFLVVHISVSRVELSRLQRLGRHRQTSYAFNLLNPAQSRLEFPEPVRDSPRSVI